ncbi:MAG TPA: histidine kinase [Pseudonocardiaceae bacterium]|jgi:signal transduction histidine kinase|nr:histidine kinase [Pseudonocardiaceae bacterium]
MAQAPLPNPPGAGLFRRLPVFVLPLVIALAQVQGTRFAGLSQAERAPLDALAVTLLVAGPVALLARRRYPVLALGVVLTVTVVYYALDYPYGPAFLSVALALAGAVLRGHRRLAWVGAGSAYVTLLLVQALPGGAPAPGLAQAAGIAAWVLVVLLASEGLRIRAERSAEAARSRAEQDRRRASEQRLQIARDLHDVLAHNISLINVQASVALHLLDEQPDAARGALTTIKQASKDVLTEMRSVLGVLRAVDEAAPRLPAPSLARLDELVARSSDAGLDLHTVVRGDPVPLPASVDVAAYRILQEALTNAARHGAAARATALIIYSGSALAVEVDNQTADAGTPGVEGTGNGIAGMRERVTALGGKFSAGVAPGSREFRVRASFPLETLPPETLPAEAT